MGTVAYMAPELLRGAVGPRGERHLGAGRDPLRDGERRAAVLRRNGIEVTGGHSAANRPRSAPAFPALLDQIIMRCLAKDPRPTLRRPRTRLGQRSTAAATVSILARDCLGVGAAGARCGSDNRRSRQRDRPGGRITPARHGLASAPRVARRLPSWHSTILPAGAGHGVAIAGNPEHADDRARPDARARHRRARSDCVRRC